MNKKRVKDFMLSIVLCGIPITLLLIGIDIYSGKGFQPIRSMLYFIIFGPALAIFIHLLMKVGENES